MKRIETRSQMLTEFPEVSSYVRVQEMLNSDTLEDDGGSIFRNKVLKNLQNEADNPYVDVDLTNAKKRL